VLRRPDSQKPKPAEPSATEPKPQQAPAPASTTPAPAPTTAVAPDTSQEDKDRPVLRRGKPAPRTTEAHGKSATPPKIEAHAASSSPISGQVQIIPAISDADGPDPRPYAYDLKPGEAEQYRKKMLDLATIDVRARAQQLAAGAVGSAPPAH